MGKPYLAGIKRNPTPLYWTMFFMAVLCSGFKIALDYESKESASDFLTLYFLCDKELRVSKRYEILT